MKPLVSVITITFNCIKSNRKETLVQCIESVRSQNYENIEHIIIDGASSDGTLDILGSYPELKVFSEPDTGVYNAFNKGILKSNGKYIVFINSDDYFSSPDSVSISVEALEKKGADYSFGDTWLLNEENPKKSEMRKPQLYKSFYKMPFCHQSVFCKTDVLKEIGMFNENRKITSDYEVYLKLLFSGYKGVDVKSQIAVFRCGGVSGDKLLYIQEICSVLKENLSVFCKITDEQISDAVEFAVFPPAVVLKLVKFLKGKDRIIFVLTQFRHFLFQIRTSKSKRTLKLFGCYIIKPKAL